jgi:hypothetical protein
MLAEWLAAKSVAWKAARKVVSLAELRAVRKVPLLVALMAGSTAALMGLQMVGQKVLWSAAPKAACSVGQSVVN